MRGIIKALGALTVVLSSASLVVLADDVPDDIFHCRNPKDVDKKESIKCDNKSQEWALNELDEEEAPEICGGDYIEDGQPETMPDEWPDLLEPCLLWSIFYGSLATDSPTAFPTATPTAAPVPATDRPTAEDGGGFCKYIHTYQYREVDCVQPEHCSSHVPSHLK